MLCQILDLVERALALQHELSHKMHCIGKDRPQTEWQEWAGFHIRHLFIKTESDVSELVIVALSGMFYEPQETGNISSRSD